MLIVVRIIMLLLLLLVSSIGIVIRLSVVVVAGICAIAHLWRVVVRVMLFSNCSHGWLRRHHSIVVAIRLLLCHFPLSMTGVVVLVNIVCCGNSRSSHSRRWTSVVEGIRLVRVVMLVRVAIFTVKSLVAAVVSSCLGEESIGKSCTDDRNKTTNRSNNDTYITTSWLFFAFGGL